jgi:hypothetical protein
MCTAESLKGGIIQGGEIDEQTNKIEFDVHGADIDGGMFERIETNSASIQQVRKRALRLRPRRVR